MANEHRELEQSLWHMCPQEVQPKSSSTLQMWRARRHCAAGHGGSGRDVFLVCNDLKEAGSTSAVFDNNDSAAFASVSPSCSRLALALARSSAASAARFAMFFEDPDADSEDATDTAIAVAAAAIAMGQPDVPCGGSHRSVWLRCAVSSSNEIV